MSSYPQVFPQNNFILQQHDTTQHYDQYLPTPHAYFENEDDCSLYGDARVYAHAFALLPPDTENCMNEQFDATRPNIRIESSTSVPLPPTYDARQDSVISSSAPSLQDWQMYQQSMGGPVAASGRPLKRQRSHQRTPSASTVASNGPASPYTANTSYPQIANTDFSPNSPSHYADQAIYSKHPPTPQQTPTDGSWMGPGYIQSQFAQTSNAHLAMKEFAIGHHMSDEYPPDFVQSSRQSMSSGQDSPATPQSGVGDNVDTKTYYTNHHGEIENENLGNEIAYSLFGNSDYRQPNPNVQLFRTESSQAYQDELYNPPAFTSTPTSATRRHPDYLTPHRNLVNERLQTANLARSASPISAISRERSPFRDGSPLAPSGRLAVSTADGPCRHGSQHPAPTKRRSRTSRICTACTAASTRANEDNLTERCHARLYRIGSAISISREYSGWLQAAHGRY